MTEPAHLHVVEAKPEPARKRWLAIAKIAFPKKSDKDLRIGAANKLARHFGHISVSADGTWYFTAPEKVED